MHSQLSLPSDHSQIKALLKTKARGFRIAAEHFEDNTIQTHTLMQLKPDYLKIFVRGDTAKVAGEIGFIGKFGASFGMKLVAIGIENAETYNGIKECGVELAMGYYLGAPATFAEVRKNQQLSFERGVDYV